MNMPSHSFAVMTRRRLGTFACGARIVLTSRIAKRLKVINFTFTPHWRDYYIGIMYDIIFSMVLVK